MYKILEKEFLNSTVVRMVIEAPLVARKAQPGQFIILRTNAEGERIPLTVADYDREAGTVTIIFQIVGATTEKLGQMAVERLCWPARSRDRDRGLAQSSRSRRWCWLCDRVPRGEEALRARRGGSRNRRLSQ